MRLTARPRLPSIAYWSRRTQGTRRCVSSASRKRMSRTCSRCWRYVLLLSVQKNYLLTAFTGPGLPSGIFAGVGRNVLPARLRVQSEWLSGPRAHGAGLAGAAAEAQYPQDCVRRDVAVVCCSGHSEGGSDERLAVHRGRGRSESSCQGPSTGRVLHSGHFVPPARSHQATSCRERGCAATVSAPRDIRYVSVNITSRIEN